MEKQVLEQKNRNEAWEWGIESEDKRERKWTYGEEKIKSPLPPVAVKRVKPAPIKHTHLDQVVSGPQRVELREECGYATDSWRGILQEGERKVEISFLSSEGQMTTESFEEAECSNLKKLFFKSLKIASTLGAILKTQ